MNCIILLLLLCCCGGNNGSCGCKSDDGCRGVQGCQKPHRHCADAVSDCDCARDVRTCRKEEREPERACDISGMVPPPWQDYPPMPKRDTCRCEE